jgi:hypothetical protein
VYSDDESDSDCEMVVYLPKTGMSERAIVPQSDNDRVNITPMEVDNDCISVGSIYDVEIENEYANGEKQVENVSDPVWDKVNEDLMNDSGVSMREIEIENERENVVTPSIVNTIDTKEREPIETVEKFLEAPNRFNNVVSFYEISYSDLMNNFEEIRASKMPKLLINRLRRKRRCIRQIEINKDRKNLGQEPIPFRKYQKWL